jgi:pimeloyl-ACP methyl ester carboxylesterase
MVEKQFDTGEVLLNYAEGPDNGPPLLLLHGQGAWWPHWEPVIPALTSKWHVYAPDFRGHGQSGHVPRGYHIGDFTRDIMRFMRALRAHPAVIIGHSLGSLVTIQLAAEHPELVRAVVLEDPPLYLNEHLEEWGLYPLVCVVQQLVTSGETLDEESVASLLIDRLEYEPPNAQFWASVIVRTDPDVYYQAFVDNSFWKGYDTDALLKGIACPILLLHGEWTRGGVVKPDALKRAMVHLPQATLHGFTGVGHLLHGPATAEEFLRVVTTFLDAQLQYS